jgi:hypothetical protein
MTEWADPDFSTEVGISIRPKGVNVMGIQCPNRV